jgi:hypothetical protein
VHVEVFRGGGGWYVRVVGNNGEKVVSSEAHRNRSDAIEIARKLAFGGFPVRIEGEDDG